MINFFVPGTPAPQGSKRYLGNGRMVESSKRVKPWRADIRTTALANFPQPLTGPIRLDLTFVMPRPKSHYGTGRNAGKLKNSAPDCHTQKPDLDKLVRAVGDALTGVAYLDDSQIIVGAYMKRWACSTNDQPGVHITVVPLEEGGKK